MPTQHSINLAALRAVRDARGGRLGFNAKFLVEMGEERDVDGQAMFGVTSMGAFFPMAPADQVRDFA